MKRSEVFARDANLCVYCGEGPPDVELTVDHVEPRMRGGDNSSGNLVTACVACNRSKGGLAAWAWLQDREEERTRFLTRATYVWPRLRAAVGRRPERAPGKGSSAGSPFDLRSPPSEGWRSRRSGPRPE